MAAFKKQSGRQQSVVGYADFDFSQLVSGVLKVLIELPPRAIIIAGALQTLTAFNSGTSDVATIGDSGSATRYKASATIAAAAYQVITPTGVEATTTALRNVGIVWTAVGTAATAGIGRLWLSYFVLGRAQFSQGLDA